MEDRSPHLPSLPLQALVLGAAAGLAVGLGQRRVRTAGDLVGLCAYSVAVTRALPGREAILAAFRRASAPERTSPGPPWNLAGARVASPTEPAVAEENTAIAITAARASL